MFLLTEQEGEQVSMFDPYFRKRPFIQEDIVLIDSEPFKRNRIVTIDRLNAKQKDGLVCPLSQGGERGHPAV